MKFVPIDLVKLKQILEPVSNTDACVILTKRVRSSKDGTIRPYNKFFCSGYDAAFTGYEPWSTTKNFAVANGVRALREYRPEGEFGLDSSTLDTRHGRTLFGDLVTSINSYDHTAGYSSNSLSRYFHELGQSDRLNELVQSNWLGIDRLSLGGPYGELAPENLQDRGLIK